MLHKYLNSLFLLSLLFLTFGCSKENVSTLKNDLIKKSIGPNLVNDTIRFAYAMAIPGGKLTSASADASVAGALKTGFGPYSWRTDNNGNDIRVMVAKNCVTNGKISGATFIDTCASTLRYNYAIPEEARGKSVSFVFSGTANNGEVVSVSTPEYKISKMDLQRNITLVTGAACYLSIKQMKAFTMAEVVANNLAGEIDLIYFYNVATGIGHSLVSPATSPEYLYTALIPAGSSNSSKLSKRRDVRDAQLGSAFSEFIDDVDFETLVMDNNEQNFVYGLTATFGAFVSTGNGKYKAYVLVNSIDNANKRMVVSIKRYAL